MASRFSLSTTLAALLLAGGVAHAQSVKPAQPAPAAAEPKPSLEFYGFVMLDMGLDFKQIDPDWAETMRVTRLPKVANEYGEDGRFYAGVRQTRFGTRTSTPTPVGELKTLFEFNFFGSGVDEGQTTIRFRHGWGELGQVGAGQTWSVFTDVDAFPKTVEFYGPTGLAWFRNPQLRWTPMSGEHTVMLALEKPGGSADDGIYADRIELQNVQARFPAPDFTAAYKYTQGWGHVRAAGLVRHLQWDDMLDDQFDLSGSATGWGLNLSSNIKAGRDLIRLAFVVGEGIQNYMNDSPKDIGIVNNFSDPRTPILGKPIPITALSAFIDHVWSDELSSTVGYSRQDNDNTEDQNADAFRDGQYALANLQYVPVPNVMVGGEIEWGRRQNFSDGFQSDGFKFQVSFKYNFSWKLGG
jgi:hypothetical protein